MGFSTKTCLPASNTFFASSKWNPFKPVIERLVNLSKIHDGHIDFKAGKYVVGDDTFKTYAEAKENAVVYGQKVKEECYQLIKDIVYAVLRRANEKFFRVQTSEGEWLFFFDNFNELKEAIEKGK